MSREIDPLETAVLSVGKIESGTAVNIIPETARIQGNVRTTNPQVRESMGGRISRIAEGIAAALRCEVKVDFIPIYPVTVNDAAMVGLLRETTGELLGEEALEELPIIMGSEDFSFYQQKVPGVLFFLGMGDPSKGTDAQHHSPNFRTNDSVLPNGVALLSSLAWRFLETFNR